MSRRLIIRPHAEEDISEAALWYENQQPGLGNDFLKEVRTAIESAVKTPLVYRRLRRRPDVRRVLTDRFPYRVFSYYAPTQS